MRVLGFKRFEFLVSFSCLVAIGYFGWHGYYGPRGYPYRDQLNQHLLALTTELDGISTQRKAIETTVALMRPESIDPDMLDELARKNLDLSGKNEFTVKVSE